MSAIPSQRCEDALGVELRCKGSELFWIGQIKWQIYCKHTIIAN